MISYKDICNRLAAHYMRESGVPVQIIAKQAGVSKSTIYRWLKGVKSYK